MAVILLDTCCLAGWTWGGWGEGMFLIKAHTCCRGTAVLPLGPPRTRCAARGGGRECRGRWGWGCEWGIKGLTWKLRIATYLERAWFSLWKLTQYSDSTYPMALLTSVLWLNPKLVCSHVFSCDIPMTDHWSQCLLFIPLQCFVSWLLATSGLWVKDRNQVRDFRVWKEWEWDQVLEFSKSLFFK